MTPPRRAPSEQQLLKKLAALADEAQRAAFLSRHRSRLRPEIVTELTERVREQVRVDVQQALADLLQDGSHFIVRHPPLFYNAVKQLASEPGPPSNCRGCKGNKNKLLAELKVMRLLQLRVNEETRDVDGLRAGAEARLSPEMRDKIGSVRDHQESLMERHRSN